jgi:hypothetical protein
LRLARCWAPQLAHSVADTKPSRSGAEAPLRRAKDQHGRASHTRAALRGRLIDARQGRCSGFVMRQTLVVRPR